MEQARQSLEGKVLERAGKDPQFRDQLKKNPRGIIAQDFGVQIPPDVTVDVVEETPSKVYLVLPATPVQRGQELTGQELESVAGGWSANSECGSCDNTCTCQGNVNCW